MNQEAVLILFQVLVLVFAFSVHESAHAYMAMRLGDPTAFMLGRVTLNPAKHLDPFGSVLIPLIGLFTGGWLIGWPSLAPSLRVISATSAVMRYSPRSPVRPAIW